MTLAVPLVDLRAQHDQIAAEVREGWDRVIAAGAFVGGEEVESCEHELASFWGVRHAVGVASGTDALELILRALFVGPGDEVIVPANTFIASAAAVVRAGAKPVLVDVDPIHLQIDPERVGAAITSRTKAVMAVHLFGEMAPVEHLTELIGRRRVAVVEDAAQAQGATRNGNPAGTHGVAAATSFYPGKNLGAYGDAGAVLTNQEALARRVRLLGNHGSPAKYVHSIVGFNSRLDPLQAVVLRAKLRYLAQWNEGRRLAAARYHELLDGVPGVLLPAVRPENVHVWHLYVIRVADRDRVLGRLHDEGIAAGVHYPVPVHLQEAFRWLGHGAGDFPVAEAAASKMISLPLDPFITVDQQRAIADLVRQEVS